MTKKTKVINGEADENKGIRLLQDHIRLQFVANADTIARNEKPERLLKMIQSCPELKTVTKANKELWRIVEKVRHDLLRDGNASPKKNTPKARPRRKK